MYFWFMCVRKNCVVAQYYYLLYKCENWFLVELAFFFLLQIFGSWPSYKPLKIVDTISWKLLLAFWHHRLIFDSLNFAIIIWWEFTTGRCSQNLVGGLPARKKTICLIKNYFRHVLIVDNFPVGCNLSPFSCGK